MVTGNRFVGSIHLLYPERDLLTREINASGDGFDRVATVVTDGIKNFLPIGDRIGTAGQPTEEQLRELAAAGYQGVINLGLLDPRYCLPDEAGLVAALGMRYEHIPVRFDAPAAADFDAFLAVMDRWAAERVFVHCALNYRVSSFIALYGEARLGWTRAQADEHARRLWQPNEIWRAFLDERRAQLLPHD
jgi:protein tyrosine phosphatase (PTP) superfamily phosphohydrolase (DUF442 family)